MRNQRRKFSSEFKTKVALEALKERETLSELAKRFELHPNQISQWRKGGIYQGIQSLLDYKREVTWGNTVATFRDTLPKTFGHEFGHIIQFNTQGWAAFQGRGIFEQLIWGLDAYDISKHPNSNEVNAWELLYNIQ